MADGDLISRASLLAGIAELKESPWYNFGKADPKVITHEYMEAMMHYGYLQRKEAGICIACGKRAADKYVRCEICEKRMNYKRRQKISYIEAHQPYLFGKG